MKKHLKPILATILALMILLSLSTTAYAKTSPKQFYKLLKQTFTSDSTATIQVKYQTINKKPTYTITANRKKDTTSIFYLLKLFSPKDYKDVRNQARSVSKDIKQYATKHKIKNADVYFIIKAKGKIVWKFKNGKLLYDFTE